MAVARGVLSPLQMRALAVVAITLLATTALADAGGPHVMFSGNEHAPDAALRAAMTLPAARRQQRVDQDALDRDAMLVQMFYADRGYATVHVAPPMYDAATDTVSFDEGPGVPRRRDPRDR